MNLKKILNILFKEVVQEAEINSAFRARLEKAFENHEKKSEPKLRSRETGPPRRASNRRPPATLDPVHLARLGESILRAELAKLDIEKLRDVVAEYGMDTGKLVMKWRDSDRIIERIVEVAKGRAQKGSAFRDQPNVDEAKTDGSD